VKQGISVDDYCQNCLICDAPLISSNVNILKRIKVFECKHAFHDECISQHMVVDFILYLISSTKFF